MLKIERSAWFKSQIENSDVYFSNISEHSVVRKSKSGTWGASTRLRQYGNCVWDYSIKKKKCVTNFKMWFSQLNWELYNHSAYATQQLILCENCMINANLLRSSQSSLIAF